MEISISPEHEVLIREKVLSGHYASASEVIDQALRLLEDRDRLLDEGGGGLRDFIAIGIEQADRGEVAPLDVDATLARVRDRKVAGRERP